MDVISRAFGRRPDRSDPIREETYEQVRHRLLAQEARLRTLDLQTEAQVPPERKKR